MVQRVGNSAFRFLEESLTYLFIFKKRSIQDKVVSVVIVMSNDRVLPHDVTTKDDLFFHVTCNYSTPVVDKIRQGIVVG